MQPPEKMVPRTIENTRELDETVCMPDDEEVLSLSPFNISFLISMVTKNLGFEFDTIWNFAK